MAALAQFLVSRKLVGYGDTVNLIGCALYLALTQLLYSIFKPVNKNLSLLAADIRAPWGMRSLAALGGSQREQNPLFKPPIVIGHNRNNGLSWNVKPLAQPWRVQSYDADAFGKSVNWK
jgi:hypothetical protein